MHAGQRQVGPQLVVGDVVDLGVHRSGQRLDRVVLETGAQDARKDAAIEGEPRAREHVPKGSGGALP